MQDIQRRSFLKKTLLAGAGAAAAPGMVKATNKTIVQEDSQPTPIAPPTGKKLSLPVRA